MINKSVIEINNISKRYRIGIEEEKPDTLSGYIFSLIKSPLYGYKKLKGLIDFESASENEVNWALKNISFNIEKGQVVGLIGKNGAGKSTLLKILSRITSPTDGSAKIYGRVASLLEVGTGFHPELTGKENVYLNGTMLGMSREEIKKKFNQIIDFAEIQNYIDTPVKRYSSGMRVRLAFAVAAHLDPEILLIDEVLAVGDIGFQKKCIGKMGDIVKKGKTILFVTHNMSALISLCTRTILLNNGKIIDDGDTNSVVKKYLSLNLDSDDNDVREKYFHNFTSEDKNVSLLAIRTINSSGEVSGDFLSREDIIFEIEFKLNQDVDNFVIGIDVKDEYGSIVFRSFHNDKKENEESTIFKKNKYKLRTKIPMMLLNGGVYTIEPCATIFKKYWIFKDVSGLLINVMFDVPNPDHTYQNSGRPGYFSPILDWKMM